MNGDQPDESVSRPQRLRGAVADRVTYAARALARHRRDQWDAKVKIAPQAVSFYYVGPERGAPVQIAARLFLDPRDDDHLMDVNPEAGGVPELHIVEILRELQSVAREDQTITGRFDPRKGMCTQVDDSMPPDAAYLGAAATTVTFPDGPQADPTIRSGVVLWDGTTMLLHGGHDYTNPDIQSTHTLDLEGQFVQWRRWKWAHERQFEGADAGTYLMLSELAGLHRLVDEPGGGEVSAAAK